MSLRGNIFGNGVIGRLACPFGKYRPGVPSTESVILDIDDVVDDYQDEEAVATLTWSYNNQTVEKDTLVVNNPGTHQITGTVTLDDGTVIQNTMEVVIDPSPSQETKHVFYYLKDHLGSTRAVIDAAGNVTESSDFYPFGLQMPGRGFLSGSIATKEGFTGKEQDGETDWQYFGARYYHPALGKWLAVDPLEEYHSGYTYVGNNPIRFYDIMGLSSSDSAEVYPEVVEGDPVTICGNCDSWWHTFGALGGASLRVSANNAQTNAASTTSEVSSKASLLSASIGFHFDLQKSMFVKNGYWYDTQRGKWYKNSYWGRRGSTTMKKDVLALAGRYGKYGSRLSNLGTGLGIFGLTIETYQVYSGEMGIGRFSYHLGSTGLSIGAAAMMGSGAGLGVATSALTLEMVYDSALWYLDHLEQVYNNFHYTTNQGRMPGFPFTFPRR